MKMQVQVGAPDFSEFEQVASQRAFAREMARRQRAAFCRDMLGLGMQVGLIATVIGWAGLCMHRFSHDCFVTIAGFVLAIFSWFFAALMDGAKERAAECPPQEPVRKSVCGWCKTVKREGIEPETTGICKPCMKKHFGMEVEE